MVLFYLLPQNINMELHNLYRATHPQTYRATCPIHKAQFCLSVYMYVCLCVCFNFYETALGTSITLGTIDHHSVVSVIRVLVTS